MWNSFDTSAYECLLTETVVLTGHEGKNIRAFSARPMDGGTHPGLVLIPHMPGWDEWCRETATRFARHGYEVICPNIYEDFGHGTPSEVANRAREAGGVYDASVMADTDASLRFLKSRANSNGKAGVIGMCSGGRHTFLAACTVPGIDAAVDCWGGGVVCPPDKLSPARPVQPLDHTAELQCPLLGIFGNDDFSPTPDDVNTLEAELKKCGKDYEFHRYDGAGHGFWYYHTPMYRQEQAMDSFNIVVRFLNEHLKE